MARDISRSPKWLMTTPLNLQQHFARRMAPIALLMGIFLAAATPISYRLLAWNRLQTQGEIYAKQISRALSTAALRQPSLWRYNAAKIADAALRFVSQGDVKSVAVLDCGHQVLYQSSTDDPHLPRATAAIRVHNQELGYVRLAMNAAKARETLIRITLVFAPIGLIFGSMLFFFPLWVVRRQEQKLHQALEDLQLMRQELESINRSLVERVNVATKDLRNLSGRVIESEEAERGRIARDLHDVLGQRITALQLDLELAISVPHKNHEHLQAAIDNSKRALSELRAVVTELHPPDLQRGSLLEALELQAEAFEARSGVRTYFRSLTKEIPSNAQSATALYRIQQEALTNIQKHAQAQEVTITLSCDKELQLEIRDDGVGFDPSQSRSGSGLRGIQERCVLLGGRYTLNSEPGRGTLIRVTLGVEAS